MIRRATACAALAALGALLAPSLLRTPALRAATSAAPILSSVTTHRPVVALTFDDGPSPFTVGVLSVLERYHAHATFFVVGSQVQRYPDFVRLEHRAGDEIGNHTFTHADLQILSDGEIAAQVESTQSAVRAAAGIEPSFVRPPYGDVDERVASEVAALGLHTILWSVDPRDWSRPGTGAIISGVLSAVRPGSVVIMHDGGGDRSETVAALPSILSALSARGYRFLTVSELFAAGGPCDLRAALRRFRATGIRPHATHPIFQQWESLYCAGTDLGPATSTERRVGRARIVQDFATTGHRLVWDRRERTVQITLVWHWAVTVFRSAGVAPFWHTAITAAWFEQFFAGHDWGPAESRPHVAAWGRWQRFRYGTAIQRGHTVTWRIVRPR